MRIFIGLILLLLSISARAQHKMQTGQWRAELTLNDSTKLPFVFNVYPEYLEIINADEKIRVDEISYRGDSVIIQLPIYETEIRAHLQENSLNGEFINHARITNTQIPFSALYGITWRFTDRPEKAIRNISGTWQVNWDGEEGENKQSIGLFHQEGSRVTGTFLTPTGDYRFLEGEMGGPLLRLSAFDGSHAYYFDAILQPDGSLSGNYYSGTHWHDTWTSYRTDSARIADPDSVTSLIPGTDRIHFSIPDENGKIISADNPEYRNKVVLVQIMGTWCSNCLDETLFLLELVKKFPESQFAVIALDFEKTTDSLRIKNNITRIKNRLGINYPVLYAGKSIKEEAVKSIEGLERIAAYPTSIVIDKTGRVRRIHSGFSGPATGQAYTDFRNSFISYLEKLMLE